VDLLKLRAVTPLLKKPKTGICHVPGSTYYNQTKNFTSFKTLDDCLKEWRKIAKEIISQGAAKSEQGASSRQLL
jgi:hypothetical protein